MLEHEMEDDEGHAQVIKKLIRDRVLAHQTLFAHRHPSLTPAFHHEIINTWHSSEPRVLFMAFRGGAKSTLSEEAILVEACLRQFKNGVILGESETRAVERLRAIKHEIEHNPYIEELFGSLVGPAWTDTRIVLANGVALQAYGRGQSLRGVKHLDQRPDRLFVDDLEDQESVATPEARDKWLRWFFSTVIPALAPEARVRVAGTPLDPQSLLMKLSSDPGWHTRTFPIESIDLLTAARTPTWPDRFSIPWIDAKRDEFHRLGLAQQYEQEYNCVAADPQLQVFHGDQFKVDASLVRSWHSVYAMVDPARTAKPGVSATTGVAIWSWINNRLIVWDSYAKYWRPDEILADMFRVGELYAPVVCGVEEDGLNEFILQPLRQEQLRRGVSLPVRAVKAPKGKLDFIRGLQPFFRAGEVIFAKPLPELAAQLLSFPTGRIDAPNALAYALTLRPGSVIYDGFSVQNIFEDLAAAPGVQCHLCVNASQFSTTAVLVQLVEGGLNVVADWVREGDPGLVLADIVRNASVESGRGARLLAPPIHFDAHDRLGLRPAAQKIPVELRRGGAVHAGREEIRALIRRQERGMPALKISTRARWTLNAFAGGYCRRLSKAGVLSEFAEEGAYRTLVEGLESFAALMRIADPRSNEKVNWRTTDDGRRYISARA